jgi:CBS domain-containing protein
MAIVDVMRLSVVSVAPDDTVAAAIGRMLEANVGAVAVTDGARLVGIFTERDVMRLAGQGDGFTHLPVREVMTSALVTVSPDVDVIAAARLMGERRIRHLPVVEGEHLLGIVSIREVLRTLVERLWREHDADARETARELLERAPEASIQTT